MQIYCRPLIVDSDHILQIKMISIIIALTFYFHQCHFAIFISMVMISSEEEVSLSEGKKNGLFRLHLIRAQNKMCQQGIYQRVLYSYVLLSFIFYILQRKGVLVVSSINVDEVHEEKTVLMFLTVEEVNFYVGKYDWQ